MALDISGFVAPEQKFEGLYKIGEGIAKQKALTGKTRGTLQSTLKFMLDPSKYYTQTVADQQINKKLFEATQAAYDYIDQNPTGQEYQLKAYMNPYIQELVDYSWKAKNANKAIQEAKKNLDPKYYDVSKFSEEANNKIFFNPDGSPKDAATLEFGDVVSDVLGNKPEIARSTFLDEWVKGQPTITVDTEKEFGSRPGTVTKKKIKITAPSYTIPEVDEQNNPVVDEFGRGKVQPRYDIAMDGYEKITHDGKPIKVLTDADYNAILRQHPSAIPFINAQLKQHLPEYRDEKGESIQLGDPRADLIAKNILWEELNRRGAGNYQIQDYKVTTTRAPRGGGGGAGAGEPEVEDVFSQIEDYIGSPQRSVIRKYGQEVGSPVNELPGNAQKALVNLANSTRKTKKYDAANMYIFKNEKGELQLMDFKTDKLVVPLDYTSVNNALKQVGAPEKREVIEEGKKKPSIIGKAVQKGKEVLSKFAPKPKQSSKDPLDLGL